MQEGITTRVEIGFDFARNPVQVLLNPMTGQLSYERYTLPFRAPLRTAHGPWVSREGFWLGWKTESGVVRSEAAPIPGFGGMSMAEIQAGLERLGSEPTESDLQLAMQQGGELAFALGSLNSDWRDWVQEGPDYVPVAGLLPAGRAAFERVDSLLELGFRTFKWKVGVGDPRDEQGMLDELLGAMPDGARVRLDANGGWDRRTAERWLSVCADRPNIEFIEQPCAADAVDLLLGLARDYPVTLALDEAVLGQADFVRWRDLGWPGVYVIKPALWGNPCDLITTMRETKADVVISSALETRVGARVTLAVAFALGGGEARAAGVGVWPLFVDATYDGPHALPFLKREAVLALADNLAEGSR